MAELRRIFVEAKRIQAIDLNTLSLILNRQESHYLCRVLRLRNGDEVAIVDGCGGLWVAILQDAGHLRLKTSYEEPLRFQSFSNPSIGLAVVVPRRGFEELLRMSCEIGVDIIQPILSTRRVPQVEERCYRWNQILKESVEQSERLWMPKLNSTIDLKDWINTYSSDSAIAFATTRLESRQELQFWIEGISNDFKQVWIAIGPEGGWTSDENSLAKNAGCALVNIADSILRTSTAAVVASQMVCSWRRLGNGRNISNSL